MSKYIQYGCGWSAASQWRNFDSSPTLRFERLPLIGSLYSKNECRFPTNVEYGDIVKGLPITPQSCSGVYCSHILEHLSLEDFRIALVNTHKLLHAGGIFRLVLPDLEHSIKKYINNPSANASMEFMQDTFLGYKTRNRGIKGLMTSWLGNSHHLWMWDFKSISVELNNAGFTKVRKAYFGDSSDATFNQVEDASRWKNSLGVECQTLS